MGGESDAAGDRGDCDTLGDAALTRTTCLTAALVGLFAPLASAAIIAVREGGDAESTSMTIEIGDTAAIDILVQLEADEVLGFANVFPSVGPLDEGPEFFETIDFEDDWDPDITDQMGHSIIISRAEGDEFPFDFGEGIYWNQYVMIFVADGVAGPGTYVLERLTIHGVAEGTTLLRLDGTLTELWTPENEPMNHSFATPALRITVLKGEDDNGNANDNVDDNGNDNTVDPGNTNDNTAANKNDNTGRNDNVGGNTNDNVAANDNATANDNVTDNANDNTAANDNTTANDNVTDNSNDNAADNDNAVENDNAVANDNGTIGGGNSNGGGSGGNGNDNGGGSTPGPVQLCGAGATASLSLSLAGLASLRLLARRRRT